MRALPVPGVRLCTGVLLVLGLAWLSPARASNTPPGALVVVGGGRTTEAIVARTMALLPAQAKVVVLPQASELEGRGLASAEMWQTAGAAQAEVLEDLGAAGTRRALADADLIWMPGGSQNRLVDALRAADLIEPIGACLRAGAVVGGTSAGAAALTKHMLTGKAELDTLRAEATELAPGLDLWAGVLVDQHFLARRRQARLLAAVLDHPEQVGVGIDESTAVIVRGDQLEVLGTGGVLVYDARRAQVGKAEPGSAHSARGVTLHLLREGDTLDLSKR